MARQKVPDYQALWDRASRSDHAYLIPTSINDCPEFRSLSCMSQLIWFFQMTMAATRRYDVNEMVAYWKVPYSEVAEALGDLLLTSYGTACKRRWASAPRRTISPRIRAAVYARDGHRCLYCGTSRRLSLDHIHPFSKGGTDTMENLQTLCVYCNSRKGAK